MPTAILSIGQSNMKRCETYLDAAIKAAYGPDSVLIPTALGGSWMDLWIPGGRCFEAALIETDIYLMQGYDLRAIICNQGEADTRPNMAGGNWANLYRACIDGFRRELGKPDLPEIHSVLGPPPVDEKRQDGTPLPRPNWMAVFSAQRDYGGLAVRQWDIPRLPHDVHYAPDTYRDAHTPRYMAHLLKVAPVVKG